MDAVDPGGLGGTFGGNPVSCAAANVVLDAGRGAGLRSPRPRRSGTQLRAALEDIATRVDAIGEVRGLGPDARDRDRARPRDQDAGAGASSRRRSPPPASEGLLLLACGLHGNVIRLLPPLTITDEELARGLEILEAALV